MDATENYWETKLNKYTQDVRRTSSMDNSVISSLRRHTTKVKYSTASDDLSQYEEKRKKLIYAQTTTASHLSNKSRILASLIPDEVIYHHKNYRRRRYFVALMFVDISGFTQHCENYTTKVEDGASTLTQILNSYIGAIVQEIFMHGGDVMKFSGDAFLAMWKTDSSTTITQAVQTVIDCGLVIQRDYGAFETESGRTLRVKVAISAGNATFSLIGDKYASHWVTIGQAVWDVKNAEMQSGPGDITVTLQAWSYINPSQYIAQKICDNTLVKILGLSSSWRNVILHSIVAEKNNEEATYIQNRSLPTMSDRDFYAQSFDTIIQMYTDTTLKSYRPSVNHAIENNLHNEFIKFISQQVKNIVEESDEPLENLTEMRYVIIVFVNIICYFGDDDLLINIIQEAYMNVQRILPKYDGIMDKMSAFDKDLVCLAVFGLRGFKNELNVLQALTCSVELKNSLSQIKHVSVVSIGVTAGFIYCGIIGHTMRRETTVIGMCVNKAARLMIVYPNKITCDQEVYLQSRKAISHFVRMPYKELKGFTINVGPIYEYLERPDSSLEMPLAMIGRENEFKVFQIWLSNLLKSIENGELTRNLLIIEGQMRVGKTKFLDEISKYLPTEYPLINIVAERDCKHKDFCVIRKLISTLIQLHYPDDYDINTKIVNFIYQNIDKYYWPDLAVILGIPLVSNDSQFKAKDISSLPSTPEVSRKKERLVPSVMSLGSINFDVETVTVNYSIEPEESSKIFSDAFIVFCKKLLKSRFFLTFDSGEDVDDISFQYIIMMLETLPVAVIYVVQQPEYLASSSLMSESMKPGTVVIHMVGIDRWHHATLTCQLLNVDAISSELEKVIQLYSEGYVGWIEKFIMLVVHSKQLHVVDMTRKEVLSMGAIISLDEELRVNRSSHRSSTNTNSSLDWMGSWEVFRTSYRTTDTYIRRSDIMEKMKVAILNPKYKFEDLQLEATSYVIFMKMYDDMDSFEKLVLKCSSAMGEIFSTNLLIQVLRVEKEENIINGILKLFELGLFVFTDKEYRLHKANISLRSNISLSMKDRRALVQSLKNAYIRFSNPLFFKYSYDLLTQNQKKHYHNIAIIILRSSIRKCQACGGGSFGTILGVKRRDNSQKSQEARAKLIEYFDNGGFHFKYFNKCKKDSPVHASERITFRSRFFSDCPQLINMKYLSQCECEYLLSAMYSQVIRHCKKCEKVNSLIEAYIEFAERKIHHSDEDEAIMIINEAEEFVKSSKFKLPENSQRILSWQRNFISGRIASKRGKIMYDFGNLVGASKCLHQAMELFEFPFPKNKHMIQLKCWYERHVKRIKLGPNFILCSVSKPIGLNEIIKNCVSETLSYLFDCFMVKGEYESASLAAEWSFNMAVKGNTDFRITCMATANMITLGRHEVQWDLCSTLEQLSMVMCQKHVATMDKTDVYAYIQLLTSILLFRLCKGDIWASIRIGQKLVTVNSFQKIHYKFVLAMAILSEMLSIKKMYRALLAFYRELKSVLYRQDLDFKTFYYGGVVDLFLETGYWLEDFSVCYEFYHEHKDLLLSRKHMGPGWYLVMGLYLCAVRTRQWETIAEWKDPTSRIAFSGQLLLCKFPTTILRFLEGQLLYLVMQIEEKHFYRCKRIRRTIAVVFEALEVIVFHAKPYVASMYQHKAYFCHINGDNEGMLKNITEGLSLALEMELFLMQDALSFMGKKMEECHKLGTIFKWVGLDLEQEVKQWEGMDEKFSNMGEEI